METVEQNSLRPAISSVEKLNLGGKRQTLSRSNGSSRSPISIPRGCEIAAQGASVLGVRSASWIRMGSPQCFNRKCRALTTAFSVFWLLGSPQAAIIVPGTTSDACSASTEYYDVSVLGCNRCVGPTGGASTPNSQLVPDEHGLHTLGLLSSCTCRSGTVITRKEDSYCASTWPAPCNLEVCSTCQPGLVPSMDKSACIPCGNSTLGIDPLAGDCKCPENSVLIESEINGELLDAKQCISCANGTRVDPTSNTCTTCQDPSMTLARDTKDGSLKCVCKSGFELVASVRLGVVKCITQSRSVTINTKTPLSLASTVKFMDFSSAETGGGAKAISFPSDLVSDMYLLAASECFFYRNEKQNRYCQALGNLCVLQHLHPSAAPCTLFDLIQKSGRATSANNGVHGWYYTLPFLSYKTNTRDLLSATGITMAMSFDAIDQSKTYDHLEFVLVAYSVNGTLKSFRRLQNQFLYCLDASSVSPTPLSSVPLWARFGVSMSTTFNCDLTALTADGMELYELYLVDHSKADGDVGRYHPVPVKNLNYADERGLYINRNKRGSDSEDDFLSNRFFLFDVASGIQVGETKPRMYRYANSIAITINTQASDPTKLYVPLLTIAYVDTQVASQAVKVDFHVVYTSDTSHLWATALTVFAITCTLFGLRVLLHIFTWQRRNTRNEEMALTAWHSFSHLLVSLVSNTARACFLVVFVLTVYFLLFFKLQSRVYLLLPVLDRQLETASKDEYFPFRVIVPLMFCCQLVTVLHKLYHQTKVQLFLIDWEKPRAKIIDMDANQVQPAPVSVWRTILVANEWNKMQTVRRTSLRLTIVAMLFLLYGCDFRSLALPIPSAQMKHFPTKSGAVPSSATDEDMAMNLYLRFACVSSLWILLCIAQRVWKWLISERFFDEPREQIFIDFCTIAKVSCFIVDETYHGFYLHCRSPYPFADGSMAELVDQLKQESTGLTVGRGLDSSMPDCQLFELFFTRKWKRKYLTLYNAVHGESATRRGISSDANDLSNAKSRLRGGGHIQSREGPSPPWLPQSTSNLIQGWPMSPHATEGMVKQAKLLSDFLKSFVENQDEQFKWRIYRMETCISRFFGIPPDMTTTRQTFFRPDTDSRFTRILCLGIENDLMLLNILCFTAFDLWLNNHATSALVTYLLESGLMAIRSHVGARNVARHSLVDPRFLI